MKHLASAFAGVLLFTSLGVACVVNVARNRMLHCLITGPFFLLLAIALALRAAGIWHFPIPELWPLVLIVVSAAFTSVPRPLVEQLAPGGRLVQPMGTGGDDEVVLFERRPEGIEACESLTPAHFVRLYGAHGFPPDEP